MKNPLLNPVPFYPETPLETEICVAIGELSGEMVLDLWDQEGCPTTDEFDRQVKIEGDYEVRTGAVTRGHVCSGHIYAVWRTPSGLKIVEVGRWT